MTVIRQIVWGVGKPIMRLPKVPVHANFLSMGGRPSSTLQDRGKLPRDNLPMMC